jgi:hypothetical protein
MLGGETPDEVGDHQIHDDHRSHIYCPQPRARWDGANGR